MDIRNFPETVVYPSEDALGKIFELQGELLQDYIKVEGLPEYPIDVNARSSQIIIKDFIGRIVEELGEAWESYESMIDLWCGDIPIQVDLMISHLQNFNEEISDALHFFMELLIYSGFTNDSVKKWVYKDTYTGVDTLHDLLEKGRYNCSSDITKLNGSFHSLVISDSDLKDEFLRGGRKLSMVYVDTAPKMLWDITYSLQIARNTLKNKPWKQTEMMTDEYLYETKISEAWLKFFKFLAYSGFSEESVYNIYYKKNMVNRFRIRSKY